MADKKLMITGRQIAWMMDGYFKTASAEGAVLELKDLLNAHCRGENISAFKNEWDSVIQGMKTVPDDGILESLFRAQLEKVSNFKERLAHYDFEVGLGREQKSYSQLTDIVRLHIDLHRQSKNREQLDAKSHSGSAYVVSGKSDKNDCYSWVNKGKCSKPANTCPYDHDPAKRGTGGKAKGGKKGKGKGKDKGRSQSPKGGKDKGKGKAGGDAKGKGRAK